MAEPIDLNQYSGVTERVRAFYARFPTGSIRTELVALEDDLVVFKALVYRDGHDPHPTTGWAYERPAVGDPGRRGAVERCERAAVGRALANRDLACGRRPSREEMEKVRRVRRSVRADAARRARREAEPAAPQRIRRLLRRVPLPAARRERIEARLREGLSDQALHDLEAYLLALLRRE
ncbi:MAG TPA: hypothetical protein VF188_03755 [Longimicrobiales bacterium]